MIQEFAALGDEAIPDLQAASDIAGKYILAKAKSTSAFVDKTGNLRSSIRFSKTKRTPRKSYNVIGKIYTLPKVGPHAHLVEFGHKIVRNGQVFGKVKPHPFLRPAADESKEEVLNIITTAMNETIKKMGDK